MKLNKIFTNSLIFTLIFQLNPHLAWSNLIEFQPNTQIKASEINANFNYVQEKFLEKRTAIEFEEFKAGQLILIEDFEAEFDKVRQNNIEVDTLLTQHISSYELNKAFSQMIENISSIEVWPTGSDGDLIVPLGQTHDILAGSILNYSNIVIDGTLNIIGPNSGEITILAANKSMIINGTINARDGIHSGGTWTLTTPLEETVSYSSALASGGNGGRGGSANSAGGAGGAGVGPHGGGGGGGGGGGSGQNGRSAGAGGDKSGSSAVRIGNCNGNGGVGNSTLSNGGNGSSGTGGAGGGGGGGCGSKRQGGGSNGGAGGGGGYMGKSGKGLYIACNCDISGTGSILVNGTDGFNGGNGANRYGGNSAGAGGGGGGGGAGGAGGALWVRAKSNTVSYSVSGGNGGNGGLGAQGGANGENGSKGQDGFYDFKSILDF